MKRRRPGAALEPIVATLLLILIVVAAAMIIYVWLSSLSSTNKSKTPQFRSIVVEASKPIHDEIDHSQCYAFIVSVRNIGKTDETIPPDSLYIYRGGVQAARGLTLGKNIRLGPGDASALTYYSTAVVEKGRVLVKVSGNHGESDALEVNLQCRLGKTTILALSASNTESNPAVYQDKYAIYSAWLEEASGFYKVYFKILPKQGVSLALLRAELLDNRLQHPSWVGGNPYHYQGLAYPDYDLEYWYPVKSSELPLYVVITIYP